MFEEEESFGELLSSISSTIDALEDILNAVGSTEDTLQKRREFTRLRDTVNGQIRRATKQINTIIRNDALSVSSSVDGDYVDAANYQEEMRN